MTQHCDISYDLCILLRVLSLESFLLPLLFKYFFYTVLLQSHLKANDFNKTIKEKNNFIRFLVCVYSTLLTQRAGYSLTVLITLLFTLSCNVSYMYIFGIVLLLKTDFLSALTKGTIKFYVT